MTPAKVIVLYIKCFLARSALIVIVCFFSVKFLVFNDLVVTVKIVELIFFELLCK